MPPLEWGADSEEPLSAVAAGNSEGILEAGRWPCPGLGHNPKLGAAGPVSLPEHRENGGTRRGCGSGRRPWHPQGGLGRAGSRGGDPKLQGGEVAPPKWWKEALLGVGWATVQAGDPPRRWGPRDRGTRGLGAVPGWAPSRTARASTELTARLEPNRRRPNLPP